MRVFVRDTGAGISSAGQEKLFQVFSAHAFALQLASSYSLKLDILLEQNVAKQGRGGILARNSTDDSLSGFQAG